MTNKRYWLRGVIIGIIALTMIVSGISLFYPNYTCLEVPPGQPTNCHRVIDFTPALITTSLAIFVVLGGGLGWLYGKIKNHKKLEANTSQL